MRCGITVTVAVVIEWERLWDALPTVSVLLWTVGMVVILGSLTQWWRVPAEWARPILLAGAIGATVESVNYGLDHRWLVLRRRCRCSCWRGTCVRRTWAG